MPPACWFSVLVWVWWLRPAEGQQQGGACSAKPCGNLTIADPFWVINMDTGRSCGSHDFQVTCLNNNTPVLRSSGNFGFAILEVAYHDRSLRVVDLRKLELVKATNSCDAPSWNTADKLAPPFKVDPVNLNLVLYDCDEAAAAVAARQNRELVATRLRCGNESEVFVRTGGYGETSAYPIDGCRACVVPVLRSPSGEANARDYKKLVSDGFLLTWDLPPRKFGRQIIFCFGSPLANQAINHVTTQ